jgi:hypothetical protein
MYIAGNGGIKPHHLRLLRRRLRHAGDSDRDRRTVSIKGDA